MKKALAQNWMGKFGIEEGEYVGTTKAALRIQQQPGKLLKTQVWATGILHTHGYQGEVAQTMRTGKKVFLAPGDIIKELHAVAIKYFKDGGIQATDEELARLRESKETIRRALADLENDGVALRTDAKGTPLSKLTPAELKRLPTGKTRLYFWLRPKNATEATVEQEWKMANRTILPEVDKNRLPTPSIYKILNIFNFEKPGKAQLKDEQFQQRVFRAYESAKAAFLREIEVDMPCSPDVDTQCLPTDVDTPRLPEVDAPGGAFERIVERIENHHQEQPAAASENLMMMTFERFHFDICQQFADARKPTPGEKLSKPIYKALGPDAPQFLQWLTRERLAPIKSAGILPDLLNNFRDAQRTGRKYEEAYQAELRRVAEANKRKAVEHVEQARKVLANPNEYSAFEIEWANEFLSQQGAA